MICACSQIFESLWYYSDTSFFGSKMREAKNKIVFVITILEMWRAWARKKDPHLHLLKMTHASKNVEVGLCTNFDQPAQRFSEKFPLETGAYKTKSN